MKSVRYIPRAPFAGGRRSSFCCKFCRCPSVFLSARKFSPNFFRTEELRSFALRRSPCCWLQAKWPSSPSTLYRQLSTAKHGKYVKLTQWRLLLCVREGCKHDYVDLWRMFLDLIGPSSLTNLFLFAPTAFHVLWHTSDYFDAKLQTFADTAIAGQQRIFFASRTLSLSFLL